MAGEQIAEQQPDAQQASQMPPMDRKIVKIDVVGTIRGANENGERRVVVEQLELAMPKAVEDYRQASALVWQHVAQFGGLALRLDNENYELYPTATFEKITVTFRSVVGITL